MDEKKKLAVLVILVVVIACVGAFQLLKKGPATQQPITKPIPDVIPSQDPAATTDTSAKNPEVAAPLAARDPFHQDALFPIEDPKAPEPIVQRRPSMDIPPFQIDKTGGLPPATLGAAQIKPDVAYRLAGAIVGAHSAAVFVDAQGSQRLIPLGGALDGDTKVIGIEKNRVTVRFKGHNITMIPGGN